MRRITQSLIGSGALSRSDPALDRVPDAPRGVGAIELVDGDDAGRRGDVDLGQPFAADHVDADEEQAARLEFGREGGADIFFAWREFRLRRLAADREVG